MQIKKITLKSTTAKFVTMFVITLLFDALIAIAAMGYSSTLGSWSLPRGWRNFSDLFGGVWAMLGTVVVLTLVVLFIAYAVRTNHRGTLRRVCVTLGLIAIVVLSALFGQKLMAGFLIGKLVTVIVILGIVLAETSIEYWLANRKHHRTTTSNTNS